MTYSNRQEAYQAMLSRAEREFRETGRLPLLTLSQNPTTGACRIVRGTTAVEDGMSATASQITTSREDAP